MLVFYRTTVVAKNRITRGTIVPIRYSLSSLIRGAVVMITGDLERVLVFGVVELFGNMVG
jgi:hypothetical protein